MSLCYRCQGKAAAAPITPLRGGKRPNPTHSTLLLLGKPHRSAPSSHPGQHPLPQRAGAAGHAESQGWILLHPFSGLPPLPSAPCAPREMLALHPLENRREQKLLKIFVSTKPPRLQPGCRRGGGEAGAAQPLLGLRATVPSPGTKAGQERGRERPFPAPGTSNKPQKSILPLSAPQVTRGLIYSPVQQMEKFPVRVLDQVLAFLSGTLRAAGAPKSSAHPSRALRGDHRDVIQQLHPPPPWRGEKAIPTGMKKTPGG